MTEKTINELEVKIARLEEILIASDKAVELSKETMKLAVAAMDKRLEGMNEFRSTLKDQTSTFITRVEFDKTVAFQNKIMGAIILFSLLLPLLINLFFKKGF